MAFYPNESNIITKPIVFEEMYLPDNIAARSKEADIIRTCLEPVSRQLKPVNCWLHGPSGSGKTCVVHHVLTGAEKTLGLRWAYINCWDTPTYYLAVHSLARELKVLGGDSQNTSIKVAAITKGLSGRPFVVVLDELDVVPSKERSAMLYNLSQIPKVGLIAISYKPGALAELDARVRSRLNPIVVPMYPYSAEDILSLLRARVELGLSAGSWSDGALEKIATLAEGNARTAVQTLRNAALFAERHRDKQLQESHVEQCWTDSGDLRKRHLLNSLTPHHQLIHELVLSEGVIALGDLWSLYRSHCGERRFQPVAQRTFNHYLQKLVSVRLLEEDYTIVNRARKRRFKVGSLLQPG